MVLAFPLSIHPGGTVMSPGVDTNLFMWTLAWNAHALVHNPFALFDANTFYPLIDSLAFSENLLGSSIIAAPILWFGGGPALAMNIVAIASIPLSALGAYLLARQLGATVPGAILAGLVFGFAPPRFFRLDQLHLTTVQWVPFCLTFAHASWQRGRARDLRIAIALFTAQALTSGHAAVFLATALVMLAVYALAVGEPLNPAQRLRDVGIAGAALLVPAVMVLAPYHRVADAVAIRRTLADYRIVGWESFLASPTHVHRWLVDTLVPGARIIDFAGAYLFPGIVPLLLAAVALAPRRVGANSRSTARNTTRTAQALALVLELIALAALVIAVWVEFRGPIRWRVDDVALMTIKSAGRAVMVALAGIAARLALLRHVPLQPIRRLQGILDWRRQKRAAAPQSDPVAFYAMLTGLCVWLSIPPPLGLWARVYWLPGFDFIRAPSRFMILGVLGLAVLTAFGFDRIARRLSRRGRSLSRLPC